MSDKMDIRQFINDIEPVLYKDSLVYHSKNWKPYNQCINDFPVHRKLTMYECIFDLDGLSSMHFKTIPEYLNETGLKFIAFKTSNNGMHIHFWVDIYGKHQKKALVEHMSQSIETIFGVKNDILPMGHGFIRAEYSFHPIKNTQKVPIFYNISDLDYVNNIDKKLRDKVTGVEFNVSETHSISGGNLTTCMKRILGGVWADGRDRMLFAIISWFKADGKSDKEICDIAYKWSKKQPGFYISKGTIYAKIKSSTGKVGCTYRHAILEELGEDMSGCKRE